MTFRNRLVNLGGTARLTRIGTATALGLATAVLTVGALGLQAAVAAPAVGGQVRQGASQQRPVRQSPSARSAGSGRAPADQASGMRRACVWPPPAGEASCFALYQPQTSVNDALAAGRTGLAAEPRGLTPREIESAYRLPVSLHSSQTVAVSIAYDTPHLAQYLAVYRKHFGLPACTNAGGCFRVVNQYGKSSPLPQSGQGSGWDLEATLDISMISVACPHCHILVVEGKDPTLGNLAETEKTAARLGARVISNSYGQPEGGLAMTYAGAYRHKGHTVVVASGDIGFTSANFPANLAAVTAVAGTQLTRATNKRGWSERVWNDLSGAGSSGCSAYVLRPSWQHRKACPGRTIADVSAVASNIPIYNRYYGGWVTVGGTSVAAPLIAGVYGLAGNGGQITTKDLYEHARMLFKITKGNNAWPGLSPKIRCGNDYMCVATPGYNAPTGLGTPDGIGAF
jgi:subtilase family serine protease